jgi:hypothetical protein
MALSSQTLLEIAACLTVATAIWKLLTQFLLSRYGTVVEGYITDRGQYAYFRYRYYLIYTYSYKGKTYTHEAQVDKATYHIWSDGGRVSIRCLPAFPYIASPEV